MLLNEIAVLLVARAAHTHTPMHSDLDADMDTDTETTALCPSGSHQNSPPGTPTPGEAERADFGWNHGGGSRSFGGEVRTRGLEALEPKQQEG